MSRTTIRQNRTETLVRALSDLAQHRARIVTRRKPRVAVAERHHELELRAPASR